VCLISRLSTWLCCFVIFCDSHELTGCGAVLPTAGLSIPVGGTQIQTELLSSLQQMPSSASNLASLAIQQQLQIAATPATVLLLFTLLQQSLGLRPSQDSDLGLHQPQASSRGLSGSPKAHGIDSEKHVGKLLQQPWLLTNYLTGHLQGSEMTDAWDSGLTELLHAVLSLICKAESGASAKALKAFCQPYIARYIPDLMS